MLTCSPTTMDQLMTTTNQALTTIVDWFLKNKLIVNLKKTECMTVMTKAKERFTSENNSTLSIDGNQIKQVFHHKLLGLVIDSHLTWNDHVDYIVSKAASRLFLLKKIKPFLSFLPTQTTTAFCWTTFHSPCLDCMANARDNEGLHQSRLVFWFENWWPVSFARNLRDFTHVKLWRNWWTVAQGASLVLQQPLQMTRQRFLGDVL